MEKAKGGIGLSFVGGSGTVSADTAPVFDQLIIDHDIIPFFAELAGSITGTGRADDADHPSRPPHNAGDDWLTLRRRRTGISSRLSAHRG